MRSINKHLLIFSFFTARFCFADYAWIPDYHHLLIKASGEYFTSSENFGSDGVKSEFTNSGQPATFNEYRFSLEGEYGFAKNWSAFLKIPFVSGLIDSAGGTALSGSGLGDLNLGFKWNFNPQRPLITLEVFSHLPLYSTSTLTLDQLALGDGSIDVGGKLHLGYRFNRHFAAGISPGFIARTSGYSSAFVLSAFGGASWNPIYFRLMGENYTSLDKPTSISTESANSEIGSGGTFARLSQNPDHFSLGAKIGYIASRKYRIEGSMMWSLMGSYAPAFFRGGINIIGDFDLYEAPPPKTKIKEIPFETEQTPYVESEDE